MDLLAEVIVILIAALMPIVLAAILLFYPREEEEPENITYIPDFYAEDTMPVASLASWHPDPLWYLELTNAGTGLRIGKRFFVAGCVDHAGTHVVDRYALRSELFCKILHQAHLRALAGSIDCHVFVRFILLQLSFLPWIILSVLAMYLPMLFVLPYMELTNVALYRDIKGEFILYHPPAADESIEV